MIHRGEVVDEQGPDHRPLGLAQAVQHLVRVHGQDAIKSADPAILVRRQSQLHVRERLPHLVKKKLKQRQCSRPAADGLDEFIDERIGDLKPAPLSRAADGLAQFASVHTVQDDGTPLQPFAETRLALEPGEGVPAQGEDDGQDAPVTKVAQLTQDRVAFPVRGQRLLELVNDDHGVLPPSAAGILGGRR
jgi:hypothetical protein